MHFKILRLLKIEFYCYQGRSHTCMPPLSLYNCIYSRFDIKYTPATIQDRQILVFRWLSRSNTSANIEFLKFLNRIRHINSYWSVLGYSTFRISKE